VLTEELFARARRHRHEPAADTTGRLSVEAIVTVADDAAALGLRQRQLAAIVRLLRHAVAVRQPE
jgi:hypothetical protein